MCHSVVNLSIALSYIFVFIFIFHLFSVFMLKFVWRNSNAFIAKYE
jgi:hypothetical protein